MEQGGTVSDGPVGSGIVNYTRRGTVVPNIPPLPGMCPGMAKISVTGTGGEFQMECVQFDCSGGTLPAGMMLRESPTRQSTGKTSVRTRPTGYFEVSSFFDIFLEVSLDGGATWSVANDPLRLTLAPAVEVDTLDSDFFPPRNGVLTQGTAPYYRPVNDVTRFGLNYTRNLRIVGFRNAQRPPLTPGSVQDVDEDCDVAFELSVDGGATYTPVTAPASCLLRNVRRPSMYDMEMLSLMVSGGSLPAGVMIRESPTQASTGQLRESPSLTKPNQICMSSFFDIFTEISLDGGATWTPAQSPTHLELHRAVPEVFSSSDWLPLAGRMECDEDGGTVAFSNGVVIRVEATDCDDTADRTPPPAPAADITKVSAITMRFGKVSFDGGTTFTAATASGTQTVRTHGSGGGGSGGVVSYDTEMLQLDLSGGTLPPGVMLRESPTRHSTGGTVKRPVSGGYRISSFFDVFIEVSLDGGATWSACDKPLHMERVASGQPKIVENNLLLPRGDYVSPPGGSSLRCATGHHIKEAKLFRMAGSIGVQPPPVGGTVSGSQNFEISFLSSDDDGATWSKKGSVVACDFDYGPPSFVAASGVYEGEITTLQIAGGSLPAGTMIRESPTKQSLGRTVSLTNSNGTATVSSFFDIFLELSTDNGATWEPFDQTLHVELEDLLVSSIVATDTFPPPGQYRQTFTAIGHFMDGMTSDVTLDLGSPPAPLPPAGNPATYQINGRAACIFTPSGLPPRTVTAPVTVQLTATATLSDGTSRDFATEMLSLNLSGGGLPAGTMIRESPTLQSMGTHTIRESPTGSFAVRSFFDVFLELSTDGGATWSPSDGPVRLAFIPRPPVVTIGPVTGITWKSATLNVSATPGGSPTAARVLFGPTTAYGSMVEVILSPNDGTTAQRLAVPLTGLLPLTTYHCVFTATNAGGSATTEDLTFTTPDTPFRVWKLTNLGNADAPNLGMPDHDGVTNLVKYGLVLTPGSSSVAALPQPQARTYSEGQRLALVFLRDPQRSDLTIQVQFAHNLFGPWTTVATSTGGAPFTGPGFVSETDTPGLAGLKTVQVRDLVNMLSVSFAFAKITYTY